MLIYPKVAFVDVCGPLEHFRLANFRTGRRLYAPITASVDGAAVPVAGSFLKIEPTCGCDDFPVRIDLLLITARPGYSAAAEDKSIK
ncbi:hypothetical protein M8009_18610 [Halomonas sp. ATCH28]|uniref:Uncharacterized protein n=1 Tax=Halomonas gemina TaxID=2945105 RepID=A0ABT0T5V6_9GAMM|nr:hypothetical protein [Halomonas gemina]MCL7942289.1 hypothetical protein [Halomonas gemina]